MAYTVKAVAEMVGVSVRALHHYDHIGLLRPASVSPAGYRLYSDADLERLQQIMFFRELDFPLAEIRQIIAGPGFDRRQALVEHRRLLRQRRRRLDDLLRSVDRTIMAMDAGTPMEASEMFKGFDEKQQEEYAREARQRWGDKNVDESERRVAGYTKADWEDVQRESGEIVNGMAALMERDPSDPEVQALVERWFRLINHRFYDCSLEIFRGLGDLYVDDARFTAFYDKVRPGLAAFTRAAMHAYCDKAEAS